MPRLVAICLIVSIVMLRIMGIHMHAHGSGDNPPVEMHVFDAGLHEEQHDDAHGAGRDHAQPQHGIAGHFGAHLESHNVQGERDIDLPGEIGRLPQFDWTPALLVLGLLLLMQPRKQPYELRVQERSPPWPRRPPHFAPPTQAPPLTA